MKGLKYSIFTVIMSEFDLEEQMEISKKFGYDGLELRVGDIPLDKKGNPEPDSDLEGFSERNLWQKFHGDIIFCFLRRLRTQKNVFGTLKKQLNKDGVGMLCGIILKQG